MPKAIYCEKKGIILHVKPSLTQGILVDFGIYYTEITDAFDTKDKTNFYSQTIGVKSNFTSTNR